MDKFEIKHEENNRGSRNRRIRRRIKLFIGLIGVITVTMLVMVLLNTVIHGRKLRPPFENLDETMTQHLTGGSCEVDFCDTKPCIITASRMLDLMDKMADPCKDFYQYACGNYKKGRALRFNERSYTPKVEASDNVLIALKKILEKPITDADSETQKKAKLLYASCGNTTRRSADSVDDVKNLFEEVDLAWPVLDDNWNASTVSFDSIVTKLEERGINTLFRIDDMISDSNPQGKVHVHCIMPTMPEEMYRASEEDDEPYVFVMYRDFMDSVLRLLEIERKQIKVFVEEIINLEKHLARSIDDTTGTPDRSDKPSRRLLRMLLGNEEDLDEIMPNVESVCKGSVNELMNVIEQEPRRAVLNYLGWRALVNILPYLGTDFKDLHDFYIGKFSDSVQIYRSSWRECSAFVRDELGLVAYKSYMDGGQFNETDEEEVKEMMTDLKSSFAAVFTRIPWLDNNTRSVFVDKLKDMKLNIGYPENLRHSRALDQAFSELDLSEEHSHFRNVIKVKTFARGLFSLHHQTGNHSEHGHLLNRKPLDTQSTYEYTKNTIDINLGLLRTPLMRLGPDFPRYTKYAQFLYLAHEMSHAFDIIGNMYIAGGKFEGTAWWPNAVLQNFHAFVSCLIQQDTVGTPSRASQGFANDVRVINNDIADLGALFVTYAGFTIHLRTHGEEEIPLPGLSLNKKQIYYTQSAQMFCELTEYQPFSDHHDAFHRSQKQRVNAALSNVEDFGAVFSCPAGSPMNPVTKCNLLN